MKSSIVFYFYCQLIFIFTVCSITESEVTTLEFQLKAIVLSRNNERYNYTHSILTNIGFNVSRHHPIHYKSKVLDKELTNIIYHNFQNKEILGYNGRIHAVITSIQDRKAFSNRLSILNILETHLETRNDSIKENATPTYTHIPNISTHTYIPYELDWIFLFEDDISLHESFISNKQAMDTIITGILYYIFTYNTILHYIYNTLILYIQYSYTILYIQA